MASFGQAAALVVVSSAVALSALGFSASADAADKYPQCAGEKTELKRVQCENDQKLKELEEIEARVANTKASIADARARSAAADGRITAAEQRSAAAEAELAKSEERKPCMAFLATEKEAGRATVQSIKDALGGRNPMEAICDAARAHGYGSSITETTSR